jgi:flagella synthesis protein FlgN
MIEKTYPITENLLNYGLNATQTLLELLHNEAENLAHKNDPQALTTIALHKKEVVVQLEQFAEQLGKVLATEKLIANHQGISHYLDIAQAAGIDTHPSKACWANITVLSQKCRVLNEQNGACIELLSRHTQRAMQILRGGSQASNTYGPDGSTRSELFSNALISV